MQRKRLDPNDSDPVLSRWISADPLFAKYLPSNDNSQNNNLPGRGGLLNPLNLSPYAYAHHNPVVILDPNGEEAVKWFSAQGRDYYAIYPDVCAAPEDKQPIGFSSISDFRKNPGIGDRQQAHDALIVNETAKYGNVTPDEIKALMLSESGGNDRKSREAFKTDPMQVLVPGDYTGEKGKYLGISKKETATAEKSTEKGVKWYSFKKDKDYNWRLTNPKIKADSSQGKLLRDPKLSGDPIRGFMGYKGWLKQQEKGANEAQKLYDNR